MGRRDQQSFDQIVERASRANERAREAAAPFGSEAAQIALVAIAEQLALSNAISILRLSKELGEIVP